MSKLLEDEKVVALIEKKVAAAVKDERKRILAGIADVHQTIDGTEIAKDVKKVLKGFVGDIKTVVKAVESKVEGPAAA